jgi:hypothetical protein
LAQTNPKSGLVQRAIAAIRKWIRENVPGFENMQLSNEEIIERYLVPAREFVQRGVTGAPGAVAGIFPAQGYTHSYRKSPVGGAGAVHARSAEPGHSGSRSEKAGGTATR